MKLFSVALLTAATLSTTISRAMTPPDKVYKVSFQTPETVFQTGFVSLGHDRDFIRYISGASTEDDSTACVSSMDLWCDVSAISEATARRHPERPIYVYYIRPTENFFNVEASLLYARDVLPPGPAWRQVDDLWRATHHWTEGAWAATAAIAGDQISVARRYYWNDDRPYFGSFFNNPNYYILPPEVSHRPLSVRNATVEAAEVAEAAHGVGFVPAAVVSTACDPQSQSLGTSRTRPCPPVTRLSFGALRTKTIAKLIVSGALMGSTSGQLRSEPGHDEL